MFKELDYSVSQVNLSRADISIIQTSPSKAQNLNLTIPGNQTAMDIGNLVEPLVNPAPMNDSCQDGKHIAGLDEQIENATIVIKQLNDKIVLLENQNEQLEAHNSKLIINL